MTIGTDITVFMEDFVDIVITIFSSCFQILDNITFAGTSLLRVSIGIMILGAVLPVLLTIAKSIGSGTARNIISERSKRNDNKQ